MKLLDAGGIEPVAGSCEVSYELGGLMNGELDRLDLEGCSVKLLDAVLHVGFPKADWKFIWIDRDRYEQAASQVKFLSAIDWAVACRAH